MEKIPGTAIEHLKEVFTFTDRHGYSNKTMAGVVGLASLTVLGGGMSLSSSFAVQDVVSEEVEFIGVNDLNMHSFRLDRSHENGLAYRFYDQTGANEYCAVTTDEGSRFILQVDTSTGDIANAFSNAQAQDLTSYDFNGLYAEECSGITHGDTMRDVAKDYGYAALGLLYLTLFTMAPTAIGRITRKEETQKRKAKRKFQEEAKERRSVYKLEREVADLRRQLDAKAPKA